MIKNVVIVEDEGVIALMLQRFISKLNCQVVGIAKDGKGAIELFIKHKPDLIIMDINIQGNMNGLETFKKIQNLEKVPVIFLTGNSIDLIKNDSLCDGYPILEKPVSLEDLKNVIENILN